MESCSKDVGFQGALLTVLLLLAVSTVPADGDSYNIVSKEKQLIKFLLDRYATFGRYGRPVVNTSEIITIRFGLSLIQILKVDEKNQVFETNVWETFTWKDALLTWDPDEHEGIKKIRVPSEQVWIPDLKLYNFADPRLKEKRDALVVVEHDGSVMWMPQAILRSNCPFSTTYFPFDSQTCKMKFGFWTYDGTQLDLDFFQDVHQMSVTDYLSATEWDIIANYANKTNFFYECCPNQPFPDLTFYITIKRKVAFYTFILILPCALLSLLTLVIFWVPPESPAKLVLGMNVFVAFFVLLLLLAESTPKAAESVPLIGTYFCLSMIMITLSTILAVIVTNMFFRGVRINRAPAWLRTLMIDIVARVFFIRHQLVEEQQTDTSQKVVCSQVRLLNDGKEERTFTMPKPPSMQNTGLQQNSGVQNIFEQNNCHTSPDSNENDRLNILKSSLATDLRKIREILEFHRDKKEKAERKEKHVREWRVICCVTDRLFFLCYLIINITMIIVIFYGIN
ncbi:neuronal acetylcholine receptor subunit alpha-4-like [Saccostrea echinata]|uniref:neuronal acetylcholine receptor subunit alpha-4-like n=1 Tax=Saccostrea echinata TaxID=191078 RepID=UPI002A83EAC2|nr:neuronal acetylcholine receptor subunit alpha-4-like [Saccostrea echinata]